MKTPKRKPILETTMDEFGRTICICGSPLGLQGTWTHNGEIIPGLYSFRHDDDHPRGPGCLCGGFTGDVEETSIHIKGEKFAKMAFEVESWKAAVVSIKKEKG